MSSVTLKPIPHFCLKTTAQSDAVDNTGGSILNPVLGITSGRKIFVNIAYSRQVPTPPDGSEEAIQRAMRGEDIDELNPDGWYVPVVVSTGRQDKDKAGNPCFVFDAVFNSGLKERVLTDPDFKMFIIELSLQRIEAQNNIALSRHISTPNLVSKGKLEPRTVVLPSSVQSKPTPKNLIQDITPVENKSILKPNPAIIQSKSNGDTTLGIEIPPWTWAKGPETITLTINVPRLTHAHVLRSTLDIEPRRIVMSIPSTYTLDINLGLSDAELMVRSAGSDNALTLKRMRDFDVDGAVAEWRVAEGVLVVTV